MLSDKKLKELYEKYLKEDRHDYYIKRKNISKENQYNKISLSSGLPQIITG